MPEDERTTRIFQATPGPEERPSGELAASLGLPWKGPGMPRLVIGRREWVALPELGVAPLHAKTDSGARSSSIHAEDVELSADERTVRFTTVNHYIHRIRCEAPVVKLGRVRSSSGVAQRRVFIETEVALPGGFRWRIRASLADRSVMRCPMLLGRQALAGYFLIDPSHSHLLGRQRELPRI